MNQKERHSELAEESRRSHPRRLLARARFLGKLGMTFFFIRLLMRGHLKPELRYDLASSAYYENALGQGVHSQTTLGLAFIYKY